MHKKSFIFAILWLLLLSVVSISRLIFPPIYAQPTTETAKVSRVIDGDTVELVDGRSVRYIGINTPETRHPQKGQECFGQEAKARNVELVEGKEVRLEKDVSETDRYDRLLRYVYVDDRMINSQLVEEGYAFASAYPPDVKYQEQLTDLQRQAEQAQRGLWGADCPTGEVQGIETRWWVEWLLEVAGVPREWRELLNSLFN